MKFLDWVREKGKHSKFFRQMVGWSFEHMSFALPVHRLKETATLIAFYHPRPCYPIHILIVPKKALAGLQDLGSEDTPFMLDLFATVKALAEELNLVEKGYRLIANGGDYQDIPQLHFHLISGELQDVFSLKSEKTNIEWRAD